MLPDRITPADNLDLLPPPDAAWLLSQMDDVTATPVARKGRISNRDINLQENFDNSQFLHDDANNEDEIGLAQDDIDLELDFGMEIDDDPKMNQTIEMGRDAPTPRAMEDDVFSELDMGRLAKGATAEPSMALDFDDGVRIADDDGDIRMGDEDFQFNIGDQSAMPDVSTAPLRARISESPLSDIDENIARDVEQEWTRFNNTSIYEPGQEQEESVHAPARKSNKKKKVFGLDPTTQLTNAHIKEQQQDHDNILKAPSFISRDPYLLALIELKNSGAFISNILMDGRSKAWAPELRGMLSLDAVRSANELKRKRDSGVADIGSDGEQASKSPRLELGEDDDAFVGQDGAFGEQSVAPDGTILEIPAAQDDSHLERDGSPLPTFDDTTAPIVHPADSGPVSIGTKHAVHILRDLFGDEAATNDEKRKKTTVVFQDLLPEQRTTKADATKMFFECLVLATKDAIKVEQNEGNLGGPIRVRGKRGLWGAWAEREASGEMAQEDEAEELPREPLAGPSAVLAAA
jgi:cohesin complex subunit SCC1